MSFSDSFGCDGVLEQYKWLNKFLSELELINVDQSRLIYMLVAVSLCLYVLMLVLRRYPSLLWLVFATVCFGGLAVSSLNLFSLYRYFTTFDHFFTLATMNEPAMINAINLAGTIVVALLWHLQESRYWRYSWSRTIAMSLFLIIFPVASLPVMISHMYSLYGEYGRGKRKYMRISGILAAIAGLILAATLPRWKQLWSASLAAEPLFAQFYEYSTATWASTLVTRTLAMLYPPIVAWCATEVSWIWFPIIAVYSLFSLPTMFAGVLFYRQIRDNSNIPQKR